MKKFATTIMVTSLLCVFALALVGCSSESSSESESDPSATLSDYTIATELSSEHYAVGFKLGNEAIADKVTLTLAEMDEDGFVADLCDKYSDQGISYDNWCLDASGVEEDESTDLSDYTLVVGFDAEYPPYGYIDDDGSYTGFDLDLAQEVCTRNGWEFEAQPIDWDAKDALIESDQISCIWNGFTYEGREDSYAFTSTYMLNSQVVVVKSDSTVSSVDDLAGLAVVTQTGSAAYELLTGDLAEKSDAFGSFETVADYTTAFMDLDSGACDAVACDYSVAAYYIAGGE